MNPVNNVTASKFWPEKIQAAPGSMVQFQFWAGNHTVTQSSFGSPCTPMTQTSNGTAAVGIKSGFQPVAASERTGQIPTYSVMINDTSPLWFYCGQGAHCQGGMAMVINER
jgi:plastocyanin